MSVVLAIIVVGRCSNTYHFHPIERVGGVELLRTAKSHQQPVCAELDVLSHEAGVHADEFDGDGVADELALDLHCIAYDLVYALLVQLVHQLRVDQTSEVAMQSLYAYTKV